MKTCWNSSKRATFLVMILTCFSHSVKAQLPSNDVSSAIDSPAFDSLSGLHIINQENNQEIPISRTNSGSSIQFMKQITLSPTPTNENLQLSPSTVATSTISASISSSSVSTETPFSLVTTLDSTADSIPNFTPDSSFVSTPDSTPGFAPGSTLDSSVSSSQSPIIVNQKTALAGSSSPQPSSLPNERSAVAGRNPSVPLGANFVAKAPATPQSMQSIGGSDSSLIDPQGSAVNSVSSWTPSNIQIDNASNPTPSKPSSSNSGSPVVAIICSVLAVGLVAGLGFVGYSRYSRNGGNILSFVELGAVLKKGKQNYHVGENESKNYSLDRPLPPLTPLHHYEDGSPYGKENVGPSHFSSEQPYSQNLHTSVYSSVNLDMTNHPSMQSSVSSDLDREFHEIASAANYPPYQSKNTMNIFGESGMTQDPPASQETINVDPYAVAAASLKAASQDSQESCHKFDSLLFGSEGNQSEVHDFISTSDLFF